jgi:hypothetical protein
MESPAPLPTPLPTPPPRPKPLPTPLFDRLLNAQFSDRPDLAEALCALFGRVLEGVAYSDPSLSIWIHGCGGSGKTVTARVLEALFTRDQVANLDPESWNDEMKLFLAHEHAEADMFRNISNGPVPGLAVSNFPPPPRPEGKSALAVFHFQHRVTDQSHTLLDDILDHELPAIRARLLLASTRLRLRALITCRTVWDALPAGVVA